MRNARKVIAFVMALVFSFNALLLPEAFAFAEQKVSDVNGNATQNIVLNGEKQYLIGLKENVDRDKFLERKSLNKKTPKKFKMSKSISVKLNLNEVKDVKNDSDVLFVESDSIATIASIGSAKKDNLDVKRMKKDSETIPWGIQAIGADLTLNEKVDGNKINIAVLDTGCVAHPDIKIKGGVSFVPNIASYSDDNGHGTHVIGTIAALDNRIGVVGVAPKAEIYAVKVLDNTGSGSYSQIIDGIEWAIDNKINIINMSFGGTEDSQALHEAIKEATSHGILMVAAAGNNGAGLETETYPARYSEVVSVGAVDQSLQRASYSSTGSKIDVVAPGTGILSTTPDGEYGVMSGTSMATPHVAGALAILLSENNKWTNEQIKQKLYQTATPLGESSNYGHGLINVAKALGITNSPIAPAFTN